VVLTDLVLPGGLSGKNLGQRLMRVNPKSKVIYASGHSLQVTAQGLPLEEGVNFLSKPFQIGQLTEAVRRALDASASSICVERC
jgi:DNA-binding NtrC family response regulator